MKLTTKTKDVLIPKWNGNRELPAAEQVKVHVKYPTNRERENISEVEYRDKGDSYIFRYDSDLIVGGCVIKIENLVDVVDGKEKPITTGYELLQSQNRMLSGLIQEIAVTILKADELDEETEKN